MLCDSPNYKLTSERAVTSQNSSSLNYNYDEMPTSATLVVVPHTTSCSTSLNNQTSLLINQESLKSKVTHRVHPNIQHHPTIHPHSRYQRSLNANSPKMPENNSPNTEITSNESFNSTDDDFINTDNNFENDGLKEADNKIRQMQELIDQLNYEIFKNPMNYTRPPSEYLEIYNSFTAQLHFWQEKKEMLHLKQNLVENEKKEIIESSTDEITNSSNEENEKSPKTLCDSPTKLQEHKNLPKFKLDHPTTLYPTTPTSPNSTNNNYYSNQLKLNSQTPTTPTSPNTNVFPLSPTCAQTSTSESAYTFSPHLPSSSSSISLAMSILNQTNTTNSTNITPNSRSFSDINDALSSASVSVMNGQSSITPTNSLSPSSSLATTPTCNNLFSSFLRVYIGSSTAVVEKKPIPLKDALISKLKSRNLEIDKCVAYMRDTNVKLDWDTEVNKLNADNIVVAEIGDEIRHSFEKKTFSLRSCDSCKKRILLNVYACSKCFYVLCQRNECINKLERIVCVTRRINSSNSLVGSMYTLSKQDFDTMGRPESPIKESLINISQQILPVHQLKVSIPSRDRSRSETELNIFVVPKLSIDANRTVQKSPSTLAKITNKNSIYGTMPRNQYAIKQSESNIDDISGSVNEESGSVLSSISGKNLTNEIGTKPEEHKIVRPISKQHKPSRRDSFNSWEIPFKQIKIDMHKKVGSGSFGIVHQGRDFYHGTVAIKFLNVQNPTPNQFKAFRNEVAILKSTRHDNVLLFIGCIFKPYLAIVTEWCPGSSLYRHIHVEEEHWEINQLIDIARQTSTGMEYLHARDILHRDLKSNNIFLIPKEPNNIKQYRHHHFANNSKNLDDFLDEQDAQKWTVKIGDFGLATVKSTWTQTANKTNQPTGSILWMAPEVIRQKVSDPYTQKSDVYSYGVVLYELFTGNLPYQHKEQNMILFLVGSGRLKLNPDDARSDTPVELKELIVTCSHYDRDKRLDFVEINQKLKKIKLAKTKLQRAQSVPNVSFSIESSHMPAGGLSIYEDEIYPATPQNLLSSEFDLDLLITNSNNLNDNETNTSQLITNL